MQQWCSSGAAHSIFNLKYFIPKETPIIFHCMLLSGHCMLLSCL